MNREKTRFNISGLIILLLLASKIVLCPDAAIAYTRSIAMNALANQYVGTEFTTNYQGNISSTIINSSAPAQHCLRDSGGEKVAWTTGPFTYPSAPQGTYTLYYEATNTYTAISYGAITLTYPYDDGNPTASISPNGWLQSGTQTITWVANDTGTDMTGIKAVIISRKDSNGIWTPFFQKNDYTWGSQPTGSFNISTSVQSIFEYKIDVTDQIGRTAGLSGDSANMNIKIDLENPALVSITSPSNGAVYTSPAIQISGRATDSYSGIKCIQIRLNGSYCSTIQIPGSPRDTGSSYFGSVNFLTANPNNKLQEGSNTITCMAEDMASRLSTGISRIITYDPPKFTQKDFTSDYYDGSGSPLISYLGDAVKFTYKTNVDGKVRISICRDAAGNDEAGLIQDSPCVKNVSASASFAGGKLEDTAWKLIPNGEYYLKAELHDSGGFEFDPKALEYISPKIKLDFQMSTVSASIKTPSNPNALDPGYRITIPGAYLRFTKQNDPMAGLYIAEGDSANTYQMPKVRTGSTVLYQVEISKGGYLTMTIRDINSSTSVIECPNYIPYMPGQAGYMDTSDTDGDGVPDGWEYLYWKDWLGWTPWHGCDLSKKDEPGKRPDGTSDPAYTYDPDGDGLANLEEYQLQKHFPNILPNSKDLLVELDWVWLDSNDIYAPKDEAKKTCSDAFQRIGITVQWAPAPQGDKITSVNQSTAWRTSVSFGELGSILSSSQGTYEGYTNPDGDVDIAHAVFAPGWTTITGLSNSPNASAGGLYLRDQHGVFVFDLRTRNLVDGQTPADSGDNVLINRYEGYILAHELGHALGLPDVGDKK